MAAKILIAGAGAVGGMLSAYLEAAGQPVCMLARGDNARQIALGGIQLITPAHQQIDARPRVITDATEVEEQDLLILATKAFSLAAVLDSVAPAIGANTLVMPIVNGLPWWIGSDQSPLESVDPEGRLRRAVPFQRLIGATLYAPTHRSSATQWVHTGQGRLLVGSVVGDLSSAQSVAAMFSGSPLAVTAVDDVRQAMWTKLAVNACFNTLCALTGAKQSEVAGDPDLGPVARGLMEEVDALTLASGSRMDTGIDTLFGTALDRGFFKPSTLQDIEAGRQLEVAALVDAPLELARHLGVTMPTLTSIGAALRLKARCAGLLP